MKTRVNGREISFEEGMTYARLAEDYAGEYPSEIVLALENNRERELFRPVAENAEISFECLSDTGGHKAYKRSVCMLFLKAANDLYGAELSNNIKIEFSIGRSYYCSLKGEKKPDDAMALAIKKRMREIVAQNIPIRKNSRKKEEACREFLSYGMKDKVDLFKYRRSSVVNLYSINKYENYFYGYMLPSTGYLKWFDLIAYDEGFMLIMPDRNAPEGSELSFKASPKLFETMKETTKWGEMLGVSTVGQLNDCIAAGGLRDLILVQEALMEKRIADIAADIVSKGSKKFIMIAGPSSSGKTSFSHRLSIELRAQGYKPHPIALDNYYLDREKIPLDKNGKKDYECLEALDVELFNRNMNDLLSGKRAELPEYNFITGKSELKGNYMSLGADDVLVIEGIHGLNDRLSYSLPKESKYKIYISALTTLNVDQHNRIPTTDARLLRRMVRDFRTRGASAQKTLDMWSSVRRGEDENIFPFQEEADAMFNSAHIYELLALKQYAEPLLFGISRDMPEYPEAQRLLKFLEYFLGVSTEGIPNNSIVREFVGGSVFPV